ncbi:hypothetical protein PR048_030761 [Dryococelus australis]|uniref:DUF4371 domain-containing protein n=1 Tax=Dryococelus australis TaxID=614101 RepID=A0ABQ9GDN6_9NEOP|nr:hypothetical protein PR048_030761 [Dryococelus australis]
MHHIQFPLELAKAKNLSLMAMLLKSVLHLGMPKWQKNFNQYSFLTRLYKGVALTLSDIVHNNSHFSLCLDESTDKTDVGQLLIFVPYFSIQEELLDLCSLHGTTKGSDIYVAVKKSVDKFSGFGKCSAIVTRGGNRALVYRQFKGVGIRVWEFASLQSRKNLELFFGLRKEIPELLSNFVLSDTTDLEKQLAFSTDITGYLNELNLKHQGKDHLVQLPEEFEDEALDFSEFSINIQNIMAEFNTRFQDFDGMKSSILLFNNPPGCSDTRTASKLTT